MELVRRGEQSRLGEELQCPQQQEQAEGIPPASQTESARGTAMTPRRDLTAPGTQSLDQV